MKKGLGLAICLTLTSTYSGLSMADGHPGAFFLRPAVGYYFPAAKRHLKSTGVSGLSLGYVFTDRFGLAAGMMVVNTDQKASIGGADVHGFLWQLDGIYRLNAIKGWSPYLLAGPAITSLKPATGTDAVTQFGASVGAGAAYFFSDAIALSFDAKDRYTFAGGKQDFLLTAGLLVLFGGHL